MGTMCFYNWETHVSSSNPSPNFEVIYKACHGLLFMSRNSGKILDVDPWAEPVADPRRTLIHSDLYLHIIIYDHDVRTF
ncbi:hypothetical protein D4764_05G0009450 [Takifugu flavidus]|uniref:Cilia- and flagella-associated protein 299 n=1 Tax=Takifugu flavidus TaxID=433684 RepID=A0A5C6N199_9TELE|nr:hypothetical protein D4764_05G0009450 [Takifugu flavidus]